MNYIITYSTEPEMFIWETDATNSDDFLINLWTFKES